MPTTNVVSALQPRQSLGSERRAHIATKPRLHAIPFAHHIPREPFSEQQDDARTARILSSAGATPGPLGELAILGLGHYDPFSHTSDYSTHADGTAH